MCPIRTGQESKGVKPKSVKISVLKPYEHNPRVCPPEAVAAVAESLRRFGWQQPIVVDEENVIVAGHTRFLAAQRLGLERAPVVTISDPEMAKAYRLIDNRVLTDWDTGLLRAQFDALDITDLDIGVFDFESLLPDVETEGLTDPEDTPDPPAEPESKPGDLYRLGDHRLLCGDSTDADAVDKVLDGAVPELMVTDPPYGVNYDPEWRQHSLDKQRVRGAYGKVENDDTSEWKDSYSLFPGNVVYVWMGALGLHVARENLVDCGFEPRSLIVWNKSALLISRGHYHWKHETAWYAVRKGANASWIGDRKQSNVWDIDKQRANETGHSTQKPVECMERPLRHHSGNVYDPFVGSGTTIIAATKQNRTCYAVELSPAYVDVCKKRWEQFTGEEAELVV